MPHRASAETSCRSPEQIAAGFFKGMRNTLVPDSPFNPARSGWPVRGAVGSAQATKHSPLQINRLARGTESGLFKDAAFTFFWQSPAETLPETAQHGASNRSAMRLIASE